MADQLFTTAYAGSAEVSAENVAAILDQLLPSNLGMVYIPDLPKRVPAGQPKQAGLREAIAWLTKEVGVDGTIPVADPIDALLERKKTHDDEIVLVMAFDPDVEADVELANAAHDAGIRVVNLAAAGDDLVFEDEVTEPDDLADVVPPFEGGTPIEQPAAEAVSPGGQIAKAVEDGVSAAAKHVYTDTGLTLQLTINVPPEGLDTIARYLAPLIVGAMGAQAQQVVAAEAPASAPVTHIGTTGGPPTAEDPAGQPHGTVVYYYNTEAGTYRPARGKARAEEQRVFLTKEQIEEVRVKKLLA